MHKNESVAKDSGQVIGASRSPANGGGDAREGGKKDVLPSNRPARDKSSRPKVDPTRYGDWERNGRCIDF
ncbi:MAG TPA: DUF1674 domain-containing protein [Gammaproteobacteria bacterium]|nr:DUF1674 domain-containing protein [Gammaproteobacteria bacterium]